MPFHFVMLIESCWLFGAMFCVLFYFVLYNLTFISVYNVSLIALDRYIALSNPFFYSSKASANMIFTTTVLIWVVSVFYNFALLYVNGNFTDFKVCDGVCLPALGPVSGIFDLTVVFILPCAIMMVLYVKIFAIARRHAIAIRANIKEIRRSDLKNNASMRSERKAAKALGILVAVFLFCLVPYYTCSIINGFVSKLLDTLIIATLTLFYLNSTFNPVIYAFFHPSFRKSMILILTCRILSKDSSTMNVLLKAN
ncbi:trace amine-associated receptor 7c-like [Denticeps clupeoides]|uniref:trace amine-associated receptor 7c-like n=1 Tax=Denticeps clupeoides TaxID=299321 RepID=UPI0010A53579|nr:trace amine-associated receptor 7c-like [Denticeps clupeoides]